MRHAAEDVLDARRLFRGSAALAPEFAAGDQAYLDCRFDAMHFEVVGHARSFATSAVDLGGELRERALEEAAHDATKPSSA